ncbi:MAG: DUF1932 domain-containing protein [Candidatus Dormibacteria bacterium]
MNTRPPTVGLLHPGEMGAAVGGSLRECAVEVLWVGRGRSSATRDRAPAAGLTEVDSLALLLHASSIVFSICPPGAAPEVANQVVPAGFAGVYVEVNAISPATALAIQDRLRRRGATFVDGAIIGAPPEPGGDTSLYLSGTGAETVADLFEGSGRLRVRVLEGPVGAASALKMCYAAWSKGSTALLLAVRAAAAGLGVDEALLAEWELSQPGLGRRFSSIQNSTPRKAWRFVAEMEQIAETLEAVGVPGDSTERRPPSSPGWPNSRIRSRDPAWTSCSTHCEIRRSRKARR